MSLEGLSYEDLTKLLWLFFVSYTFLLFLFLVVSYSENEGQIE